jgi:hypothetical protein
MTDTTQQEQTDHQDRRVNVPIPGELHQKLRVIAAYRDITIRDAVVEAITDWAAGQPDRTAS